MAIAVTLCTQDFPLLCALLHICTPCQSLPALGATCLSIVPTLLAFLDMHGSSTSRSPANAQDFRICQYSLPSALWFPSISRLHTLPLCIPVNVSRAALRLFTLHDPGPVRLASRTFLRSFPGQSSVDTPELIVEDTRSEKVCRSNWCSQIADV